MRAEIGVEAAQQARAAVRERRLDTEPVEDRRELDRDVAAAHEQRALRQPLQEKRFVRRDRVLASRDRRHLRPGAGRDENVLRRECLAVDLDAYARPERSRGRDES
jgi:hypothetical protein